MQIEGSHTSSSLNLSGNNVTVRRPPKQHSKMAQTALTTTNGAYQEPNNDHESALYDSILSQSEETEVRKMLEIEGEIMGSILPFTSTQMGGLHKRRPSILMSPIMDRAYQNPSCNQLNDDAEINFLLGNNRFAPLEDEMTLRNEINTQEMGSTIAMDNNNSSSQGTTTGKALHDLIPSNGTGGGGPQQRAGPDTVVKEVSDAVPVSEPGLSKEIGEEGSDTDEAFSEHSADMNPTHIAAKFAKVDELLDTLGNKSTSLTGMVSDLRESLEFSQKEIDMLKAENRELRQKVSDLETEESRSAYQLNRLDDKIDRVDTQSRRKNLIFDGVPEKDSKEDVVKTIWNLFDQLNINARMDFDACYRQGNYNPNRTRPILISFQTLNDPDMVYSSRMNLRKTMSYKQVWINEDLGPTSKKTRNLIRSITKKAQAEGIDCRSGKYALQVNKEKFDGNKLDELPPPLHPSNIKQFDLDEKTVVYQSEYAPFSNMFPVCIVIGQYKFISLEQAYQFFCAKTMNKLLAATKIYLSRNQVEIKRMGDDLGQSDLWDAKKFDIMYICLKKKFEQNAELKEMLLKTGDRELVEVTPNRLWGCGATLSSNLLKRHEWPGDNKQGKILMTVRDELRQTASKTAG